MNEKDAPLSPTEAIRLIQFILGIFMVVTGVYLAIPLELIVPTSVWAQTAAAVPLFVHSIGVVAIISGVGSIYGSVKGHTTCTSLAIWLSVSLFAAILVQRLLMVGFFPIIWLYPFTLMLIAAVLALTVKVRRR